MKDIKFIDGTDKGSKFMLLDNVDKMDIGLRPVLMFRKEDSITGFMFGFRIRIQPRRATTMDEMVKHFNENHNSVKLKVSKKHASFCVIYQGVFDKSTENMFLQKMKEELSKTIDELLSEYNNSDNKFEEKRLKDYLLKSVENSVNCFLESGEKINGNSSYELKNGVLFDSESKEVYKYTLTNQSGNNSEEPTKI